MGRAAAIAYAREGVDVAINYLPDEEPDAKEGIALIENEGRKAVALPGDIRDDSFCEKLVEDATATLGGLDIFVNNDGRQPQAGKVGTSHPKPSCDDQDEHLRNVLADECRLTIVALRWGGDRHHDVGAGLRSF